MNKKVSVAKVISYSGAFIALLIGSGFATGQELMQYFASYGRNGMFGLLIVFVLFLIIGNELIRTGYEKNFENPNDIYLEVCGNYVGKFFDYFSVFFLFLSYTVMVAGAQATAQEQYNSPKYVGGIILAIIVMTTVYFGLDKIVEVIGSIGPVIVVLAIVVGAISVFKNLGNLPNAASDLEVARNSGELKIASSNFVFAAGSYVGFCVIWLSAFLARLGRGLNSVREGKLSIFGGALGFCLASLIVSIAIFLAIGRLYASQIPMLILAREIHPILSHIFSIVIFLGIFTTAVPLLWNVVARFGEDKSKKYRILTIVLGVIGAAIGLTINFNKLVNVVYVLNGYIGLIFALVLIIRYATRKVR